MAESPEKPLPGETASSGAVCCPRCAADEGAPPGSTCHGARSAATAPWRIQDAQACLAGEAVLKPAAGDIPVEGEVWQQARGGFTLYALAAYGALRCRFRSAKCVVVEAVEVTDHLGDRVLVTAVRIPGLSLLLSGATWGYAGTGPNGLAAILQDLGAFADHETAIRWVSQLPIDRAWRLEIRAEPA
ncbi:MAG: hypothetical protein QOD49_1538 [Actinomycetota bacterium]|nr:hypothetical protein [Actinomycetota bacterium]